MQELKSNEQKIDNLTKEITYSLKVMNILKQLIKDHKSEMKKKGILLDEKLSEIKKLKREMKKK